MAETDHTSESEVDYPKGVTDEASCLEYLKKKEVFLYKMMYDPSHKAMLYFLEVLMNSEAPLTIEQLAARFSNKTFSAEMREACGGGSPEGLREFLLRYPSLFTVGANGHVNSVAIELPDVGTLPDGFQDMDCWSGYSTHNSTVSTPHSVTFEEAAKCNSGNKIDKPPGIDGTKSTSSLSLISNASSFSNPFSVPTRNKKPGKVGLQDPCQIKTNGNIPTRTTTAAMGNCSTPLQDHVQLRACDLHVSDKRCCDSLPATSISTCSCVHCPIVELNCHCCHPSYMNNHHHHHATTTTTHCVCANPRLSCLSLCASVQAQTSQIKSSVSNTVCALPPLERLTLETEAVRFFQQRLQRKEERWVQIKSLAGHLSQARAEIRAVVGPQLEFRNFLLRHPHVFEVQGELVSVRDPFGGFHSNRKDRDHGIHNSYSSANLLPQGYFTENGPARYDRTNRPKSLVLPNNRSFTFGQLSRTLTHLGDREQGNGAELVMHGRSCLNLSDTTNSAPRTPTGMPPEVLAPHTYSKASNLIPAESKRPAFSTGNSIFENPLCASKSTTSMSILMSANEYRSVMFVRKVLEKRGGASNQRGLPFNELLQILLERSPEVVRSTIGWTQVEVEEFLNQHHLFFEVCSLPTQPTFSSTSPSIDTTQAALPTLVVKNKRLEKMINIVITESKQMESNVRSLTNCCGRIYHVTKLWGIIDLGKHEHVFFDKSIFKHIDDLQKHFKVDEILYFNAILAPKESRAKWRATQVWKECDRKTMEKVNIQSTTSHIHQSPPVQTFHQSLSNSCNTQPFSVDQQDYGSADGDNEETEAEGEIEEIDVRSMSLTDHPLGLAVDAYLREKNDEFALNGEEDLEEEEPMISAVARGEGLHLVNDIKFISDEVTQDDFVRPKPDGNLKCQSAERDGGNCLAHCSEHVRGQKPTDEDSKNRFVSSSTENTPSECASSIHSGDCSCDASSRNDVTKSVSSGSCSISIAVQTMSTGEIMATNLYHDQKKQPCSSQC